MQSHYSSASENVVIRDWQPSDRTAVADLIAAVLAEYGLTFEPDRTDQDAVQVESAYWEVGGEFWVVEQKGRLVGTAGFYPISRGKKAVEIRKMYLHPTVRGQGLGRHLLTLLEQTIAHRGFEEIWVETATVLKTAVQFYERAGYQAVFGGESSGCGSNLASCGSASALKPEAPRCDRVYLKVISQSISPEKV